MLCSSSDSDGHQKSYPVVCLIDLINWHIQAGTQGLVILGTTGEAPTITARERARIIEDTVVHVDGRIPVIVGAGTNSTHTTASKYKKLLY